MSPLGWGLLSTGMFVLYLLLLPVFATAAGWYGKRRNWGYNAYQSIRHYMDTNGVPWCYGVLWPFAVPITIVVFAMIALFYYPAQYVIHAPDHIIKYLENKS